MKMKTKIMFMSAMLVGCVACSNDEDLSYDSSEPQREADVIVLHERDSAFNWEKDGEGLRPKHLNRSVALTYNDYIGRSVRPDYYPIEDTRNIGYQVINIKGLEAYKPEYVLSISDKSSDVSSFSYTYFDNYIENSKITRKFTSGFSLDLGLFTIGAKKTHEKVFSYDSSSEKTRTFGELNIIVRDSCYRLEYNSNIKKLIWDRYLSKDFLTDLHTLHPYEFFKTYGAFVVRNFSTGGRAQVLYHGVNAKLTHRVDHESDMSKEINASFKFDSQNGSGSLSLGRGNSGEKSITKTFSSVLMSVKTIGGLPSYGALSAAKEVCETNVDLSSWMASLSDKSSLELVEYNNEGLIPIQDFILEENLIGDIERYMSGSIPDDVKIQEPIIFIGTVDYRMPILVCGAVLITRTGDRIPLGVNQFNYDDDFDAVIEEIKLWSEAYRKLFKLKIVYNTPWYDDVVYDGGYTRAGYGRYLFPQGVDMDTYLNKFRKFYKDGIVYVIDQDRKVGFSYFASQKYVKLYTLSEFINKIPYIYWITPYQLKNEGYTIYAL